MSVIGSFATVDDAVRVAARMIADGDTLGHVWRFAIVQMFDDYQSVLKHGGVAAGRRMWAEAPSQSGDVRVDAAFAALAEYLARRDGWTAPRWVNDPRREARPWWFVTPLRGIHPRALLESPASFRRRGVFITTGALERA